MFRNTLRPHPSFSIPTRTRPRRGPAPSRRHRRRGAIMTIAREQARRMADQGTLYHNPRLTTQVTSWRLVGENVGTGPDPLTVHRAFMRSPSHRANVLSREFTRIGVGAVARDGQVWV